MVKSLFSRGIVWVRDAGVLGGLICLLSAGAYAADPPKDSPRTNPPQSAPRDISKDARDTKKDAVKDARDTAKDTAKDARDAKGNRDPRDTRDTVKDNVRDTTRDVKDTARDVRDNVREGVGEARDAVRGAREGVREGLKEGAREGKRRSAEEWGVSFGKATDRGVPISKLNSSSVAYKAGLRDSDVILSVDGHALRSGDDFERWVYAGPRNERVKVIVWRGGREEVIYLEPTVLYVEDEPNYAEDYRYFGVDLDDRVRDRIIVRKVYPDTPAYASGLREGDVITTWRGERLATPRDFGRLIQRVEPGTLKFEYSRDAKTIPGEVKFTARATGPAVRQERREERREAPVAPIRNR